jgi:Flp pilus assembly protein TadD
MRQRSIATIVWVGLTSVCFSRGVSAVEPENKATAIEPENADTRYALGLSLVRQHDYGGALELLRRAHELAPDNARYAYVYAVALNSTGASADAMALLEQVHRQHPADKDILTNLISTARDKGDFALALRHARDLLTLDPANPQIRSLVSDLEKRQTH